jgi:hypothetical protein
MELEFPAEAAGIAQYSEKFLLMNLFNHHIIGPFPKKDRPALPQETQLHPFHASAGVY